MPMAMWKTRAEAEPRRTMPRVYPRVADVLLGRDAEVPAEDSPEL